MDSRIKRRLAVGLGANLYYQSVTVVVQILGVPLLLHTWGIRMYGEWLVIFAIPAYLAMVDLGFAQSAGNDMTARVARGDRLGALSVFQSLSVLVCSASMLAILVSAVLIWTLPLADWLHLETIDSDASRWTIWLLSLAVISTLPGGLVSAGLRASGDYALNVGIAGTSRLLQSAAIWITAILGGHLVAAAAVFLGMSIAASVASTLLLIRRHPWLRFSARVNIAELKRLMHPALANVSIPLAQALNIQGLVLVVSACLGPIAVVIFSTLRTLTRFALQAVMSVSHTAEPELASAFGAANFTLMRSLFLHSIRLAFCLAVMAAVFLALSGSYILRIWTHGTVEMHWPLFGCLLASAVTGVAWYGRLILLKAMNLHIRAALVYVVASGVTVGVAALLMSSTGTLTGAGGSLLLLDMVMTLYTWRVSSRLLHAEPSSSAIRRNESSPLSEVSSPFNADVQTPQTKQSMKLSRIWPW